MTMTTCDALVACSDLAGYSKFASTQTEAEIFQLLSDYYEWIGDAIAPAHGQVVKFMGDATLMFFPEADAGVKILFELQATGDRFFSERGIPCRHHLRAHFGPVVCGDVGTRNNKRMDIFGATVNALFSLKSSGVVITPEAFRKLHAETRQQFKKHTPPITYIPTSQPHRAM